MQVLITGANRGIGAALAAQALANGHSVVGTARDIAGLDPAVEWIELEVTSPDSQANMASALAGRTLDILVCNAGVYLDKTLSADRQLTAEIMQSTFETNVTGTWLTIQALLGNLKSSKGKTAVISSKMGSSTYANGGGYAYRASKAALTNLACNLATDLKQDGVAVGAYHPGWVRTDMGGKGGDISIDECSPALWRQIEALSLETTGIFEDYTGQKLPF